MEEEKKWISKEEALARLEEENWEKGMSYTGFYCN